MVRNSTGLKKRLTKELKLALSSLTSDQLRYVLARLECSTAQEAAEAIGIKPNTVYQWKSRDAARIDEAIDLALTVAIYDAVERLVLVNIRAANALAESLDSVNEAERTRAARAILCGTRQNIIRGGSWKTIRWAVLQRDGFRCRYCGQEAADGVRLEVDHVVPRSAGGSDNMSNLLTACEECNQGKRDSWPSDRELNLRCKVE